jgi:hypothetical protein
MIKYFYALIFLIFSFVYLSSCTDPATGPNSNLPPETFLTVFSMPGDTIAPGSTIKKVSWWGDSPNGYVVGFRISFDSLTWTYTTKNDSTFIFQINSQDTILKFWVASVDDKNIVDPTPASTLYPVINTPPSMVFNFGTELPDTIFPVASVMWTGADTNGNETIKYYWYSLNDTNSFKRISGNLNLMTLTKDSGLTAGNHCIYMKAQDNAGAFSKIVRMPADSTKYFYVRPVTGRVLLIKDMPLTIGEPANFDSYFSNALDTVKYDVLDIKSNSGKLIPKIVNPMFIETLKLFKVVIWGGNKGGTNTGNDPNFSLARSSLPYYSVAGGKILWASGFPDNISSFSINYAPIDSITSCYQSINLPIDTVISLDASYPQLKLSYTIATTRGIYTSGNSKVLYQLPPYRPVPPTCTMFFNIAIKSPINNPNVVFFTMPIYYLNSDLQVSKQLIKQILFNEFGM